MRVGEGGRDRASYRDRDSYRDSYRDRASYSARGRMARWVTLPARSAVTMGSY